MTKPEPRRYSEPRKDIVLVTILIVVGASLLGIGYAGLFSWVPVEFFTGPAPTPTPK